MRRRSIPVVLGLVLVAAWGSRAQAGEVVLANGDVLHGRVAASGRQVLLVHPDLGEIAFDRAKLRSCVVDEGLPSEAGPTTTPRPAPALAVVTRAPIGPPPPAVQPKEDGASKRPWDLGVTFGLSDENGNTDKFALNFDVEAEYRWRRSRLSGRIRTSYEEANAVQTEGKYHTLLRYDRRVSPRGTIWGKWISDRDDFADLLLRTGWYAGYEHDFIKTKRTTWSTSAGLGYLIEDRVNVPLLKATSAFLGTSFAHEFSKGDTLRVDYWIMPYLENTDRSPMRLELRYAHPLRAHFDVTAGFIFDYVPNPPERGIRPWDTKLVFGVRWKP
ncbi:MAG: DUF481 domain-containing protein [Planctomycetota bacterium]